MKAAAVAVTVVTTLTCPNCEYANEAPDGKGYMTPQSGRRKSWVEERKGQRPNGRCMGRENGDVH